MIVGIMDFSQFLFFNEALTDRARAGARYAVTHTCCSSTDIDAMKNIVLFESTTAPGGATTGLYGLTASYVNVVPTTVGGVITRVEVNITGFPLTLISPYLYKGAMTVKPIRVVRQAEGLVSARRAFGFCRRF
jgi:hypothetical protein